MKSQKNPPKTSIPSRYTQMAGKLVKIECFGIKVLKIEYFPCKPLVAPCKPLVTPYKRFKSPQNWSKIECLPYNPW